MKPARWAALLALMFVVMAAPVLAGAAATVKVGTYSNEPLIFQGKDGRHQGVYVDLLEEVAKQEGWTLKYVEGSWKECLDRLGQGEIDLLVAIGYNSERAERYDF